MGLFNPCQLLMVFDERFRL